MMKENNNNKINIQLKTLDNIKVTSIKQKTTTHESYGILVERRNHKVKTDEDKLYGTRKFHRYY